ncbi:hypothetical protein BC937DRAFT_93685 [Endogone sp. FLAS-F59071]|nr:hypothetical protein BC937DRAFT_93685 [Endogone sp. FLAS-F59071]|eukprot:RUS14521.1 hypothetical protein BC937DRAFT_93685 [Endogone sp. FLAS-F59071]
MTIVKLLIPSACALYCLTRPYCSYCGNICLFDSKKANLTTSVSGTCQDLIKEVPSLANSTNVCPAREYHRKLIAYGYGTLVPLGSQNSGYLAPNQFVDFKTFVDNPSANIVFNITTSPANFTIDFETLNTWQGDINNQNNAILYNRTSVTIGAIIYDNENMTTLVNISNLLQNYDPLVGTSPNVTFPASDPRRFSGYYIYRLSNPGLNGSSSDNVSYTLYVYTSVPGMPPQDPDDGGFLMGFDLTTFAIFFFTFLVLFCSLVFVVRKVRDLLLLRNGRLMWLRVSRERGGEQGEMMWPAEVYSILVSRKWWEVEDNKNGAGRKDSDTGGIKGAGEMVESEPKLTRLLSQANDMTIVEEPDDSFTQQSQSSPHEIELLRIPSRTTHALPPSPLSSVAPTSSLSSSVMSARPRRRFSVVSSAASLISRRTATTTVNGDEDDGGVGDGPMARGFKAKKWVVCERIKDLKVS